MTHHSHYSHNPTARRHYDREDRRATLVMYAKIAFALVLACVFFALPFMSWSPQ